MRKISFSIIVVLLWTNALSAQDKEINRLFPEIKDTLMTLDSNTAYFEGKIKDYIIYAPDGFKMLAKEAVTEGYSLAFVPETDRYDSCGMFITVTSYNLDHKEKNGRTFANILTHDTADIRSHFGENIIIEPYDSVFNATGDTVHTFYLNNKTGFIPNIMISYYDGSTEMLIFELLISNGYPQILAEGIYLETIRKFKVLTRGQLQE